MITLIEALNYRCLRYIEQPLGHFHVLIGPNASGKTTFLDVISFLGNLVSEGLDAAIEERTKNFHDLVWMRSKDSFELAIEAKIPADRQAQLGKQPYDTVRYEIKIGNMNGETEIIAEKVLLKQATPKPCRERSLFPDYYVDSPQTILTPKGKKYGRTVVNKVYGGNDNYYSEVHSEPGKGWSPAFKLGTRKSALGNLPADESKFPVATWLKGLLTEGVQEFILNSMLLRKASPPGQTRGFKPDGSNLPWVVKHLKSKALDKYNDWIAHLQTALPDLANIQTIVREDDKHCYLVLEYHDRLNVPSWMASDGTLRLLALTLPAYLPDFKGIYLIEEPENGIHPRAVETMYQSLSSVYNAQILLATHSPVILGLAEPEKILCFARTTQGATDIVLGSQHPALKNWKGETNLGILFAGGVLG
ncbi:MAG: methylation-associated defense system AAA family ATPase MAD3 [Desulfurispora sp.]|uniref:methylation-associated defense system AAA family ATPase MAD3 n=1 Tax=Desulfurispora sp. TaxID=3014275 RepID=UPI00404B23C7